MPLEDILRSLKKFFEVAKKCKRNVKNVQKAVDHDTGKKKESG